VFRVHLTSIYDEEAGYYLSVHEVKGITAYPRKGAILVEDFPQLQKEGDLFIPDDSLGSELSCYLILGDVTSFLSDTEVSLLFPKYWELHKENEVVVRYQGMSITVKVLFTTFEAYLDACKEKALLAPSEPFAFEREEEDSFARSFAFTAPYTGYYNFSLESEGEGEERIAMDLYDQEGNRLEGLGVTGPLPLQADKSVLLQKGESCLWVVESFLSSNRVLVRPEKEVASLELVLTEGTGVLVYGLEDNGYWDEEGAYHFYPSSPLANMHTLFVTYTDQTTETLYFTDHRIYLDVDGEAYVPGEKTIAMMVSFLGKEIEKSIPVYSLEEYFLAGDEVSLGKAHSLFSENYGKPWRGFVSLEKDGSYRFTLPEDFYGNLCVYEEDGRKILDHSEGYTTVIELSGEKTYYLQYRTYSEGEEITLLVEGEKKIVSFSGEMTRKEPFFKGEKALGSWAGDEFIISVSSLLSYLSCEVEYEDGSRESIPGTDARLMVDFEDTVYAGENTLTVCFHEEKISVSWYFYEVKEAFDASPSLSLDTPCQVNYSGEGTGRLSFTAPEDRIYWIYTEGELETGLTLYDEAGKVAYEIVEPFGEIPGFRLSWQMSKGDVLYLDTYPLKEKEATYNVMASSEDPDEKETITLQKPRKVKAVNVAKGISVTWEKVEGAKFYHLYCKAGAGKYLLLATLRETTYIHTGVKAGEKYQYKVKAAGYEEEERIYETSPAKASSAIYRLEPCKKVKLSKKGKLSWKKVTGATGYEVRARSKSSSGYEYTYRQTEKNSFKVKGMFAGSFKVYVRPMLEKGGKVYYGAYVSGGTYKK
ncbi:MAG: hypothetical protein IIZ39_09470, partial [Blautia sp.]|nr:hypothetical protein [Blautia sp.]